MKNIILAFLIFYIGDVMGMNVNINIKNIDSNKEGDIIVFIFSELGFPKVHAKALRKITIPVTNSEAIVTFENVPSEYAVKVLHDENRDGKVTKNWTGIYPREGLGFSNKQKLGAFGPPTFKKAKVKQIEKNKLLEIEILYP